eukprot:117448-Chlamydomonas_euryale.AAC.1
MAQGMLAGRRAGEAVRLSFYEDAGLARIPAGSGPPRPLGGNFYELFAYMISPPQAFAHFPPLTLTLHTHTHCHNSTHSCLCACAALAAQVWFRFFPREQFLIVNADEYFEKPHLVVKKVWRADGHAACVD